MKRARPSATSSGAGVSPASSGTVSVPGHAPIGIQPAKFPTAALLKKHIMQATVCKSVTLAAKAPKMPECVALASLSPQRGEGLRFIIGGVNKISKFHRREFKRTVMLGAGRTRERNRGAER